MKQSQIGMFPGVPYSEYRAVDAMNSSALNTIANSSPAHWAYALANEQDTDATILGSLVHTLVLEPTELQNRYWVKPEYKGAGIKEKIAKLKEENAGKIDISIGLFKKSVSIAQAVSRATGLFEAADSLEMTCFFVDSVTGLFCKSRIDGIITDAHTLLDLKTTTNARGTDFANAVERYGYHRQGAFYRQAARALGVEVDRYLIVAVETEAPYPVSVFEIGSDWLDAGEKELVPLKRTYKRCQETGVWESYPTGIQTLTRPRWANKENE